MLLKKSQTSKNTLGLLSQDKRPAVLNRRSGLCLFSVGLWSAVCLLSGCVNGENKNNNKPPEVRTVIKKVGVPEAQHRKLVTASFQRGYKHGQSIAICTLLVQTRNYEVVWESNLQSLPKRPPMVPYLLGFLDSAHSSSPDTNDEARRIARQQAPKLSGSADQSNEQIRERCLASLSRLVRLTRNTKNPEKFIASSSKSALLQAMSRELRSGVRRDQLANILGILQFINDPKGTRELVQVFERALLDHEWALLRQTLQALTKVKDPTLHGIYEKAFTELQRIKEELGLQAELLRRMAEQKQNKTTLALLEKVLTNSDEQRLRLAALSGLSYYQQANTLEQAKALKLLSAFILSKSPLPLRKSAVVTVGGFKNASGIGSLKACLKSIKEKPSENRDEMIKLIEATLKDMKI